MRVGDYYDPSLRPRDDVGGEPSIVLQGRAQARTSPESEQPNPSPGVDDQERSEALASPGNAGRLHAAVFRKRGGASETSRKR